jgi:2-keto-3-deoxy-6-phosphogluconate aldolase
MPGGDGWRDMVRDAVAVQAAEVTERHPGASADLRISRVGLSPEAHRFIVEAARRRGISISGYIRRASLAVAAMDLGLDPKDLFALDIGIAPIGRRGAPPSKDLDGELYGDWAVQPRE